MSTTQEELNIYFYGDSLYVATSLRSLEEHLQYHLRVFTASSVIPTTDFKSSYYQKIADLATEEAIRMMIELGKTPPFYVGDKYAYAQEVLEDQTLFSSVENRLSSPWD